MKITMSPTGEITIDTNGSTPAEVAGTILAVQQELRKQLEQAERPVSLNDCQGATYDWMVEHDCEAGIHISSLGKAFGITTSAAGHRMTGLVRDGFVRNVGTGRYRAVMA